MHYFAFMGIAIFIVSILIIITAAILVLSWHQQHLTKIQLREFNFTPTDKIPIQCTFSTIGFAKAVAAYPVKADLYVGENYFLITPRPGVWGALIVGNLPVVITKNKEWIKGISKVNNIIIPDHLSVTAMNTVRFEYKLDMKKRYITVKVLDKQKSGEVLKIKNWL